MLDEEQREIVEKAKENALRAMRDVLDDVGLTAEYLTEKLKAELSATETKSFSYKGDSFESAEKVAWDIRQRARQDAHKLRGDYPSEKHDHTITGVVTGPELSEEDRLQVEAVKEVLRAKNREK